VKFGIIIIGDEILSGRRQDRHLPRAIEILAERGLELAWCRILADDRQSLTANLVQTLATGEAVFSFGGIGATPDDHTRACAAQAAGVELARHPEALAEIESRFGAQAYPVRVRMADLPAGSHIIPNPYNRVPGFSLAHHHFLPGFPQMAWPMMEWVLDNKYSRFYRTGAVQAVITVYDVPESELVDLMEDFVTRYPALRFSSLPHMEGEQRRIELGVKGASEAVAEGVDFIKTTLAPRGLRWEETSTYASIVS
jgi:molybdopterin-biosynthesis enzyme MoeA-like protein